MPGPPSFSPPPPPSSSSVYYPPASSPTPSSNSSSGSAPSSGSGSPSGSSSSGPNTFYIVDVKPEVALTTVAAFLIVVGLFQWGSFLLAKLRKQRRSRAATADLEATHASTPSRASGGWISRLPTMAINVFRVVAFRYTIEFGTYDLSVVHILLTCAYLALLLALTFSNIPSGLGITPAIKVDIWAARAGLIAASQFPLVTALGTKNNIISLVTGVGYEKLNFFHRVMARSCFALLLIHAGGEIYSAVSSNIFQYIVKETWLRLGLTAVSALAILLVVSMRPIRTRVYEVFFYSHFILVLIFLIGAYYHTSYSHVSFWIWPSFMFWGLDRLLRLTRVLVCNHLYFGFSRRAKLQDASTELLADDFVRLRIRRPPHVQWWPGQTAYLTVPSVSKFPLEAHPFSISSIDSDLFRDDTKDFVIGERGVTADTEDWKELVFLINVRNGFTKRLREAAAQNRTVKVFIDGPYGSAPDVGTYDTSILIAGGSGITHNLPVFLNAIEKARTRSSRCQRLVFIWSIRDASQIRWISDALNRASTVVPSWLTVSVKIFVTRGPVPLNEVDPDQTPGKDMGSQEGVAPPFVRFESGRADVKAILQGEVSTATGSMSVMVCGSQSLARSVRRALRFPVSGPSSILRGGPSVTLHVESFGYA
ncbi:putative ferric reductase [Chiua virens]|nr:putative ferric reductase [Chiua virens]